MKTHYFVVAGHVDSSGNVHLFYDKGITEDVLPGTVWDDMIGGWQIVDETTEANDESILSSLLARLDNTK
jgi:hypothetical protein